MRRKLIVGLMILNGLLAIFLVAAPALSQIMPLSLFSCCKTEATELGGGYCCESCCWLTWNCRFDEDCEPGSPN
ncbi:MAG: hypothetical protein E4G90_08880 [Gemmatimonadales bacterium]|nr:MAG: hypothetical protein E4G90_08880 [Gemmatimonadales bacterium]